MAQNSQDIQVFSGLEDSFPHTQKFSHEAMATTFEIFIQNDNPDYANKAANVAFDELDSLQQQLSRYIENSDISRINNLALGETARIGLPAFECLNIAKDIHSQTNGAFDVTIGLLYDCWLDENKKILKPLNTQLEFAKEHTGIHFLELDQAEYTVKLLGEKTCLDLGGIGKGYAIDQVANLLQDWSIDKALIHGGLSTILAMDAPTGQKGWPVNVSNPIDINKTSTNLLLSNRSLSISGLQKGSHIIDPRLAEPCHTNISAWASAETAAKADALSTAFMVMNHQEIERYCFDNPRIFSAVILEHKPQKIHFFGPWDKCGLLEK
ncbi:MAG: FAD:protein FMN transferase [Planctomycetota bacterium]|jgi:thiamine biosynthesis lipoprotein